MSEFLLRAADWWLGTAIGGGLVMLVGCLLMRLTSQPAARQRLGELAVIAALLVAGLRLMPAWMAVEWPAKPVAENQTPDPVMAAAEPVIFTEYPVLSESPLPEAPADAPVLAETRMPVTGWLISIYLFVAAILAARWLLGQWALNRLLRQARPALPRVRKLFASMAAGLIRPMPRLRLTCRLRAPVCFGLRRPSVLLPESMEDAADAELRWVFAHELTHLRRRDPWSSWGLGLAQAVYFFLPWFWWLRRQVRLCQEYVADAAAAGAGPAADEYAEFLVSLARGTAAPLGATGLGTSSDLLRRVQMLLQSKSAVQGSWPRGRSLLAASGLLAVAVFAGGVGLRAEPPQTETKPEERKDVIIFKSDGDMPPKYIKRLIDLKAVEDGSLGKVLVLLADGVEDDGNAGEKNKPGEKVKKVQGRVLILVETENGPVTVPIDIDSSDSTKEIEKAVQKARVEAAAARRQRSKAIEKALESLKGELNDEQIQQLRKHLEAMKATKAAAEQKRAWIAAPAAPGAPPALPKPAPVAGTGFFHKTTVAGGGSRLGVRVEQPSPALADQLDLPKGQCLVIAEVMMDSPAAKAGLAANDILLELAGKAVSNDPGQFIKWLHQVPADEPVIAVVLRKGHKEKLGGIKLPEAKADEPVMLWKVDPTPGGKVLRGTITLREAPDGKPLAPDAPTPKPAPRLDRDKQEETHRQKMDEIQLNLQLQLDDLRQKLGEDHPKVQAVRERMEQLRKTMPDEKPGTKPVESRPQRGTVILRESPDGNIIYQATPAEKNKQSPADANRKLADTEMKLKEMLGTFGPEHPQIVKMRDEIARLRDQLEQAKRAAKPAEGEKTVSVRVNDGRFEIVQSQGDLKISLAGAVDAGKKSVDGITISEGGASKKYKQLADVPEQYRDTVKQMMSFASPVRFEFKHADENQPQK
jgi:beta-lactamase regulating signal transducer with metallopeptidase domain